MVSSPTAPDPVTTAQAQAGYNQDTATTQQLLNMTNQVTPYGNITYNQTGNSTFTGSDGKTYTVPQFTQTTTLNPQQQSTLDYTQSAANNIAQTANTLSGSGLSSISQPVDTSGAPALQTSIGNGYSTALGGAYGTSLGNGYSTQLGDTYSTALGSGYQTSYGDANSFADQYNQTVNAVNDQLNQNTDKQAEQSRAQMLASGIRSGSAAYNANEQSINNAYTNNMNTAVQTGASLQNQLVSQAQQAAEFNNSSLLNQFNAQNSASLNQSTFQNQAALDQFNAQNNAQLNAQNFTNSAATTAANFNNSARNDWLSQYYQQRDQPLNELNALLSSSQVSNPNTATSATPTTQVGGVDYSGLVENNYQQQMAQSNAITSGLFSVAAAGAGSLGKMSDIRVKTDIHHLFTFPNGLSLYQFRYKADPSARHIGLMAQEVLEHYPDAVSLGDDGFYRVHYDLAFSRLREDADG